MSEMIERIAKALHEQRTFTWLMAAGPGADRSVVLWEDDNDSYKNRIRNEARTILEAMLEPTPEMIDAASHALVVNDDGNDPREVWQLMISAALDKPT